MSLGIPYPEVEDLALSGLHRQDLHQVMRVYGRSLPDGSVALTVTSLLTGMPSTTTAMFRTPAKITAHVVIQSATRDMTNTWIGSRTSQMKSSGSPNLAGSWHL